VTSPWGRIADDGTVYVRDGDGEREIGSWHAGSAEEGLAFYQRKYDDLAAEVKLLEGRIARPGSDVKAIAASARKLAESLPTATVIGDLAALAHRLEGVQAKIEERRAEQAQQRAEAAAAAAARKAALVEEAEQLANSDAWRAGTERFRTIVEEWKAIRGVDKPTDSALWERFSAARREFDRRRRAAAAQAEADRGLAAERKEALVKQAEKLSGSTEWGDTARRFRELMTEWKAAGRAGREADEALWARFKAAQDAFFTARSAAFAARDQKLQQNLETKQALLREAESLDTANADAVRKHLRRLQERWEAAGRVPRDAMADIERRFGEVEDRLRRAADAGRTVQRSESPLVIRLRESVGKLENRLQRARAAGDDRLVEETEASLATQREWLEQAEAAGR
jgi:hypothetical protein